MNQIWTKFSRGECDLTFLNRDRSPFNGSMDEFEKLHSGLSGFRNMATNKVILINHFGEIAAYGKIGEECL